MPWRHERLRSISVDRLQALKWLLSQSHPGIAYNRHFDVEGVIAFYHACKLGCEGIDLFPPKEEAHANGNNRPKLCQRRRYASCRSAGAVAFDAAAVKEVASAASTVQQARFYGHSTRHYVVKCYRELVVGPYVCRRFYRL
jgi:hypothetical protein